MSHEKHDIEEGEKRSTKEPERTGQGNAADRNDGRPRTVEEARAAADAAFKKRDRLAAEQPTVLESSATDPEFPAMQEFEVDAGGPPANKRKFPGLIWAVIAVAAVVILCVVLALSGDWMTPDQAERESQLQFEEQTVPEDLGANT